MMRTNNQPQPLHLTALLCSASALLLRLLLLLPLLLPLLCLCFCSASASAVPFLLLCSALPCSSRQHADLVIYQLTKTRKRSNTNHENARSLVQNKTCAGSRRLLDTPTAHAIASLTLAAHASLTASSADEKGQGGKDKKGGEKAAADANREARAAKLGGAAGVKGVKLSWLLYSGGKLVICGGKDTHSHNIAQRNAA
jgi:hypothetical protein